ncbi:hypothetical protein MtrunA17_Chr2g0320241 [Medicago truncatula]|uniref:Transmembrane protein, putative n=1 Tax=Medicago truncatula TaxID=3880 RepID=A0A072VL82_MEDTR|nr:transmembrane protein, putative [Medicago truncatula]RHN75353.1 hypothetical protein MtrunA17_Chr2g0320241 [Medicago truncatula]
MCVPLGLDFCVFLLVCAAVVAVLVQQFGFPMLVSLGLFIGEAGVCLVLASISQPHRLMPFLSWDVLGWWCSVYMRHLIILIPFIREFLSAPCSFSM